jgi:hypothetical protein
MTASTIRTSSRPRTSSSAADCATGFETRPSTPPAARNACVPRTTRRDAGPVEDNQNPVRARGERTRRGLAYDAESIQNHLSELHRLGFLQRTNRNRGESGGRYDEYDLDLAPEIVLDSSDEIETERDR